jgi:hypothetical protein
MPRLVVCDHELEPDGLWLLCPAHRAEAAAALIPDLETAMFQTQGERRAEFRELRLAAIALAQSRTAFSGSPESSPSTPGMRTASEPKQYENGPDEEET